MRIFFVITLVFLSTLLIAQTDSVLVKQIVPSTEITTDTSETVAFKPKTGFSKFWRGDYPNPKKALFIALALPGAGQIYNKKYWKTPIFYGGMGALIYLEVDNVRTYRLYKRNYKAMVDGDDNTVADSLFANVTPQRMKQARDQFQVYVEYTAVGMGLLYLFAVADAYVDAHLASFDVSDDLSLRIKPTLENTTIGIGLSFNFH